MMFHSVCTQKSNEEIKVVRENLHVNVGQRVRMDCQLTGKVKSNGKSSLFFICSSFC